MGMAGLSVAAFLLSPRPASAVININAEYGFNQTFKSGGWTPLRVRLENVADPQHPAAKVEDFRGELRATVIGLDGASVRYVRPVELSAQQSRKLVELSIIPPARASMLTIEMVDKQGGIVAKAEVPMGSRAANDPNDPDQRREVMVNPTVLLVAEADANVGFPSWVSRASNVSRISPELLPSVHRSYESVRLIVIRQRLSNILTPAQLEALKTWVELGGQLLIVTPRAAGEMKADPWIASILPAPIETAEEARLFDLVADSGSELTLLTRWGTRDPSARSLWDSPAGPVALERPLGAGRVIAMGIDPSALSATELRTPAGMRMQRLLESFVLGWQPEDVRARHYWSTGQVDPAFSSVLILPNIWVVSAILIMFVVVVGPLNFFLLRRRKRLELAWVTIPGLSIFFFVAVYAYGVSAKGGDQHLASTEILHLSSGQEKGLLLWSSVQFSPKRRTYELHPGGQGAILPTLTYYENPTVYAAGMRNMQFGGGSLAGGMAAASEGPASALASDEGGYDLRSPVSQWTMEFYQGERIAPVKGTIEGSVTLISAEKSRIRISNRTEAYLADAEVAVGARLYPIGDLAPGASFDEVFSGMGTPPRPGKEIPEYKRADDGFHASASRAVREGASKTYPALPLQAPQRRCRLTARQGEWSSGVEMKPTPEKQKSCGFAEVDLPLFIEGEIDLKSDQALAQRVTDYSHNGVQFFDNPNNVCQIADGWIEMTFAPPELGAAARFVKGRLTINHTAYSNRLVVKCFDYTLGDWVEAQAGIGPAAGAGMPPAPGSGPGRSSGAIETLEVAIKPEWVNSDGPYLRVRLEGVAVQGGTKPAMRFGGNMGVVVQAIRASMTFAPESVGK